MARSAGPPDGRGRMGGIAGSFAISFAMLLRKVHQMPERQPYPLDAKLAALRTKVLRDVLSAAEWQKRISRILSSMEHAADCCAVLDMFVACGLDVFEVLLLAGGDELSEGVMAAASLVQYASEALQEVARRWSRRTPQIRQVEVRVPTHNNTVVMSRAVQDELARCGMLPEGDGDGDGVTDRPGGFADVIRLELDGKLCTVKVPGKIASPYCGRLERVAWHAGGTGLPHLAVTYS